MSAPSALEHLDRAVGTSFEYSNANYVVLGMVIQAVSGQSYEAYVQEHIFKPLEMHNSFTSQVEAQQHGLSSGYQRWFGFPVASGDLPYPRGMVPGGYLISSAEDLGHYLIAQMNQGRYRRCLDPVPTRHPGFAYSCRSGGAGRISQTAIRILCDGLVCDGNERHPGDRS